MKDTSAPVRAANVARVVTTSDVIALLKERVDAAGSQRAYAAAAGLNAADLSMALKGTKHPTRSLRRAVGVEDALVLREQPASRSEGGL